MMKQTKLLLLAITLLFSATSCDTQHDSSWIPSAAVPAYDRSEVALSNEDFETAATELTEALRHAPGHATLLHNRALAYMRLERYEESLADADAAIAKETDAITYYVRARCKRKMGDHEGSLADYDRAIEIDPQYAAAFNNRGLIYFETLDEPDLAIEDFTQAIQADPTLYNAYRNRGDAYYQLDQLELAETDLLKAIELQPQFELAYYSLGCVFQNQGRYDKSIEMLTQAIELSPGDYTNWYERGQSYYFDSKCQEALSDLDQAQELAPDYAMQYIVRGNVYTELEQYDLAVAAYHDAINRLTSDADHAACYFRMSDAYYFQDDLDQSLESLNKAIQLNPTNPSYYRDRAIVHEELGNAELAAEDQLMLIELELTNEEN